MKKLLMLILIALLVALSIFIVINGISIGRVEILGYYGMRDRNDELDEKIQEATKLATTEYKENLQTLEKDARELEAKKQEYQSLSISSDGADLQIASQFQRYNYERLLVELGRHATSEGANLKIDVVGDGIELQLGTNEKIYLYDFNFTVTGSYVAITSFVSDIENDQDLGFRIEQFKLKPGTSTTNLQATFTCKNIPMIEKIPVIVTTTENTEDTENEENTNTTNNTNNTTNTNNSNSSNSTNTTNNTNTTNDTNTSNNTNTQ